MTLIVARPVVPSPARSADLRTGDGRKTYQTPELVLVAPAQKALRGTQFNQPYRDCSNQWTTGYPQNC